MEEPCRHDPFSPAECHGDQPRLLLPRDVRHGLLGSRWEAAMSRPWMLPFALAFALLSCGGAAVADAQPLPAASGRVIEAADGDVVVVPRDARVTVVTRGQGTGASRLCGGTADAAAPAWTTPTQVVRPRASGYGRSAASPRAHLLPARRRRPVPFGSAASIRAPIRSLAVNPIYPPEAQRARIQGVVILEIRHRCRWRRRQRADPPVDSGARSGGPGRRAPVALRADAAEWRARARDHDGDRELRAAARRTMTAGGGTGPTTAASERPGLVL